MAHFATALKTPATFHEQRQKLQRAKMGDLLKHKIQQRPDRTELIRQHILEGIDIQIPFCLERMFDKNLFQTRAKWTRRWPSVSAC